MFDQMSISYLIGSRLASHGTQKITKSIPNDSSGNNKYLLDKITVNCIMKALFINKLLHLLKI